MTKLLLVAACAILLVFPSCSKEQEIDLAHDTSSLIFNVMDLTTTRNTSEFIKELSEVGDDLVEEYEDLRDIYEGEAA
jgi:hypothetical protein